MFGFVMASMQELETSQQERYQAVYCGICQKIKESQGQLCRLGLSYDMAFLAILLESLYEPQETQGTSRCVRHPVKAQSWITSEAVDYAAQMNVALACYKARDDWQDDHALSAKIMDVVFSRNLDAIAQRYPRQCQAMEGCIRQLSQLEAGRCENPDEPANVFGQLMAELLAWKDDLWAPQLRQMGFYLGRFIYLADALVDLPRDRKKGAYNPFLTLGDPEMQKAQWEEYLLMAMAGCTNAYERLPLVQDKAILDNILYSGVWVRYRQMLGAKRKEPQNG